MEGDQTGTHQTQMAALLSLYDKTRQNTKKYQIHKNFKVLVPTREDWQKPGLTTNPNVSYWFTDGSGQNNSYGAGIYGPGTDYRRSISLGSLATVFQAEIAAILQCVELLISREMRKVKIVICTDSRAALSALEKPTTESSLVWDCMTALEKLGKSNRVILAWVPGHQGIHGNEVADGLAKEGSNRNSIDRSIGMPFVEGKTTIKKRMDQEHLHRWNNCLGCRRAKLMMNRPTPSRFVELMTLSRTRLRVTIGLLTGHVALKAHLLKMKIAEDDICRLCGQNGEDSVHILCHCPALACKRYSAGNRPFLEPADIHTLGLGRLTALASDPRLGLLP